MTSQLKCMRVGHRQKQITIVCLNSECSELRLNCQLCLQQNLHSQHLQDTRDWEDFREWYCDSKSQNLSLNRILENVRQVVDNLISIVQSLNQNALSDIDSMPTQQLITQIQNLLMIQKITKNSETSISEAFNKLTFVTQQFKEFPQPQRQNTFGSQNNSKIKTGSNIQPRRSKSIQNESFIELIVQKKISEHFLSPQPDLQNYEQNQEDTFKIEEIQDITVFSNVDRQDKIVLSHQCTRAKNDILGGFCICLPSKNWYSWYKLKFKIIRLSQFGEVHIGYCNRASLKEAQFRPDLTKTGHGLYLINNFGQTFSSREKQTHSGKNSFTFAENDEITIQLYNSSIIWKKNMIEKEHIMAIKNDLELYPCVGLYFAEIEVRDCLELQNSFYQQY